VVYEQGRVRLESKQVSPEPVTYFAGDFNGFAASVPLPVRPPPGLALPVLPCLVCLSLVCPWFAWSGLLVRAPVSGGFVLGGLIVGARLIFGSPR